MTVNDKAERLMNQIPRWQRFIIPQFQSRGCDSPRLERGQPGRELTASARECAWISLGRIRRYLQRPESHSLWPQLCQLHHFTHNSEIVYSWFCFTDISRSTYMSPPWIGCGLGWAPKVRLIALCWLGFGAEPRAYLWALRNTRPDVRVSRRYWAIGSLICHHYYSPFSLLHIDINLIH